MNADEQAGLGLVLIRSRDYPGSHTIANRSIGGAAALLSRGHRLRENLTLNVMQLCKNVLPIFTADNLNDGDRPAAE
jgi:hypothetical protein